MDPLRPAIAPHAEMIRHVLSLIDFKNFAYPIRMQLSHDGYILYLYIRVKERETGTNVEVSHPKAVPPWIQHGGRPEDVLRWVIECVQGAVRHELEEQMHYDGYRIFDPHRKRDYFTPPEFVMRDDGVLERIQRFAKELKAGQGEDL